MEEKQPGRLQNPDNDRAPVIIDKVIYTERENGFYGIAFPGLKPGFSCRRKTASR